MDKRNYPVEQARALALELQGAIVAWPGSDRRRCEEFIRDMTMQDFVNAAEFQPTKATRDQALLLAAFMNHEDASERTTLGEVLAAAPEGEDEE